MRKPSLLTLILAFFAATMQALAASGHFVVSAEGDRGTYVTTVRAYIDRGSAAAYRYWGDGTYEVAAFIDGDCRGLAVEGESRNIVFWDERDDY